MRDASVPDAGYSSEMGFGSTFGLSAGAGKRRPPESRVTRRRFLAASRDVGLALTCGAAIPAVAAQRSVPPSEKLVVGVAGIRGRGALLALEFALRPDVDVAYLCDVDTSLFESKPPSGYLRFAPPECHGPRADGIARAQGKPAQTIQDFRQMLDDKDVDAIVVATPDHWHALATIWGCQAGKHVYVEKPASHTPWEGRKMVEAARKYDRVVQLGTQSRSAPYLIAAKEYIRSGKLGRITMCRVYNQKNWGNQPARADETAPSHLDWEMWNGPAPAHPYNFNYWEHWNHYWRYSGGDIINDAIHQIDLARWLIDKDYPKSVYSVGGRWSEAGDFETPDNQVAVFEYDDLLMTIELTLNTPYMIKADQELRDSDLFPHWPQNATRIELYGEQGLMIVGRHGAGWQVFGRPLQRQPVVVEQQYGRFPDPEHREDFCDAIRNHRRPNADIEEGHRSTLLPQYANISYRLGGEKLLVDPRTERFTNSEAGNDLLKREYRSPWIVPESV